MDQTRYKNILKRQQLRGFLRGGCLYYKYARKKNMKNKTNWQQIKESIKDIDSAAEMAGALDGIHAAAVIYCMQHCKEELHKTIAGTKVTICGMINYLQAPTEE